MTNVIFELDSPHVDFEIEGSRNPPEPLTNRPALRRPRRCPGNLQFHSVFFPTALFLSVEEVSVITEIVRARESRLVNLLPYPSCPGAIYERQ